MKVIICSDDHDSQIQDVLWVLVDDEASGAKDIRRAIARAEEVFSDHAEYLAAKEISKDD